MDIAIPNDTLIKSNDKYLFAKYTPVKYDLLKIKPDSKLTGTFYDTIVKAIYSTRKPLIERVSHERTTKYNGTIQVNLMNPVTYEIMFDGANKKTTPTICFGIPEMHSQYLKQRIQGILPQSTLTFESDYLERFNDSYTCEYSYAKNSMLSLKIKDNNFLQAILQLKNEIQKDELILFQVIMMPIGNSWKTFQDDKWDKIREGKDVTKKNGSIVRAFDAVYDEMQNILELADSVMGVQSPKRDLAAKDRVNVSDFSSASKTKKSDDGFNVEIKAYFVCKSKLRARTYATTIETAMRELEETGGNRLVMGKIGLQKGKLDRHSTINPLKRNIMGGRELASIVNIPNQKQQREFHMEFVNTKQVDVPKECKNIKDGVRIGLMELYGETFFAYFPNDKNFLAMPKFYLAGMGSGKSTALLNYANDVVRSGQSLIDINFVSKCELAYAIKDMHSSHIIVDMSDENKLPSLMLPEVRILDTDTPFQKKRKASDCATEIEYFINSITSNGTEDISTMMGQYLYCAAQIVFIYNNMSIRYVFDILDDKKVRDKWIDKAIESGVYVEDDYEIRKLRDLDDDKGGKKVSGVIGRYSVLMRNPTFRVMLDSTNPQFDFIDIMDSGKSISICMPEDEFRNKATKDVIITYLMCRLRLAMLSRKDRDKVVHVLIDEAHHLHNSLEVISDSIAEPRKYGVAFCFCTHYFDQMGDRLKKAALNVGGHYMLLKGVGESAYNELQKKIGNEWSYDDIKDMDDYNSFNMIWIRGGHNIFVTKMLPPLKNKNGELYIK